MFVCGACKAPTLTIGKIIDLPSDDDDDLSLQIVACGRCGTESVAVYRESRRGSLDGDSYHHDAWSVPVETVREIERAIDACPSPRDARCGCRTHQLWANDGYRAHLDGSRWYTIRRQ